MRMVFITADVDFIGGPSDDFRAVVRGDTWSWTAQARDANGDAVDLTGYTPTLQVRESYDADTTMLSLTVGSGLTLDAEAGNIAVSTLTSALPNGGDVVYDLQIADGTDVYTIVRGSLRLLQEVTR